MAHFKGSHREVKAECRKKEAGPGMHYGPWVECFGVGGLKMDWSIQAKNNRVLLSSTGAYLRGT